MFSRFLDSIKKTKMTSNTSNMSGNEAKQFQDDLANISSMMKTLRMTYDPKLYLVNVLQLQESKWTKKMEDIVNCHQHQ